MKTVCCGILIWFLVPASPGQEPGEILERIDRQIEADNRVVVSTMIIHGRRASREISSKSWIQGEERSFTEYLSPPREKGVKMLKLEDQLWTYSPATDRTIHISGHMLRQSVMGSDLSYEDMMEDARLKDMYSAEIVGEEAIDGRLCWILSLVAMREDVAYHGRKIWVDKERYLPLREERLARSGKLLKTTQVKEVRREGERWLAVHIVFKDALKKGEGTEFLLDEVTFDAEIPEHIFSKASLRK